MYCYSEEPAGDEESRIVLKTFRARSFAAAQDDSIGPFFRSFLSPACAAVKGRRYRKCHGRSANAVGGRQEGL